MCDGLRPRLISIKSTAFIGRTGWSCQSLPKTRPFTSFQCAVRWCRFICKLPARRAEVSGANRRRPCRRQAQWKFDNLNRLTDVISIRDCAGQPVDKEKVPNF
jgi:hypothetical protein